jgi:branched-chain amino acid aminotransferase
MIQPSNPALKSQPASRASSPRPGEILINHQGRIAPASEVLLPALDHGFLYGDSVYETLRTFHGKPFRLDRHLERLRRSMQRLRLDSPCGEEELELEVQRIIGRFQEIQGRGTDVALRIVVTRGVGPISLDITRCREPRFLIYAFGVPENLPELLETGIAAVISSVRRNHPSALDPSIKSGNFLNNILAFQDAQAAGAHEAILLAADGYVAEGTTSNVFLVKNGSVYTPSPYGILDGITRSVVQEICRELDRPFTESRIPVAELLAADEAFITSSVRGLVPVVSINGRKLGDGRPGALTRQLIAGYQKVVDRECRG